MTFVVNSSFKSSKRKIRPNFLNLTDSRKMNLPYFIAHRLIKGRREGTSFSRPINVIAIIGIAMGLAVMILAVAILTGFKQQIRDKVVGFGSHIQIMNFDSNISFETTPDKRHSEIYSSKLSKSRALPMLKYLQPKQG